MIETSGLHLRRWRPGDVEPFHAMGQDPEVMAHLGPLMSRADAEATVERQNAVADEYGSCFWAVERRADGTFLGFCGIKPGPAGTPIADLPEIGWRLARHAWGQGYAREAAAACLADAWGRGEPRVYAITTPGNERSWGLMIRLGMRRLADGDFDHPALAEGDPLRRHLTYAIDRP
jgi:RimJ/RimL family protein N-acetyltransferase